MASKVAAPVVTVVQGGGPDERLAKLREENERRRKKIEDEERRRKQVDELKAKEALERRRLERLEQDERMRKPWQQPPEPRKPILKKGTRQKPVKVVEPRQDPLRQSQLEEKRKEWRQGLQEFITQQRQVAKKPETDSPPPAGSAPAGSAAAGGPTVPLTWQELKLAAEAGFDELLRDKEDEAEQGTGQEKPMYRATRNRSPYKSPFRGPAAAPPEMVQVKLVPVQPPPMPAAPAAQPLNDAQPQSLAAGMGNSYKFSDAPWPQHAPQPGAMGQAHGEVAGIATGPDGPPEADGAAPGAWPPSASADGADAGDSVTSSGGLRRGVVAAARYRPLPHNPLDEDGEGAEDAGSEIDMGIAGEPGYGGELQQGMLDMDGHLQHRHHLDQGAESGSTAAPARAVLDPPMDDPLEASLLASGALGQQEGLRLVSPREQPAWQQQQQQPWQQDAAPAATALPHAAAPQQPAAAATPLARQRKGWGVPPAAAAGSPHDTASSADGQSASAHSIAVGDSGAFPDQLPAWAVNALAAEKAASASALREEAQQLHQHPQHPQQQPGAAQGAQAAGAWPVDQSADLVCYASGATSACVSPERAPTAATTSSAPAAAAPAAVAATALPAPPVPVLAPQTVAMPRPTAPPAPAASNGTASTGSSLSGVLLPPRPSSASQSAPPPLPMAAAQGCGQPAYRAPSPPGSPPRGGTPQRSHRTLTVPPVSAPAPEPITVPAPSTPCTPAAGAADAALASPSRRSAVVATTPATPSRLTAAQQQSVAQRQPAAAPAAAQQPPAQLLTPTAASAAPALPMVPGAAGMPSWMGLANAVAHVQPPSAAAPQPLLVLAPPPASPPQQPLLPATYASSLKHPAPASASTFAQAPMAKGAAPASAHIAAPQAAAAAAAQSKPAVPAAAPPQPAAMAAAHAVHHPPPAAAPAPRLAQVVPPPAAAAQPLPPAAASPTCPSPDRPATATVPDESQPADDDGMLGDDGMGSSAGKPGSSTMVSILTGSHISAKPGTAESAGSEAHSPMGDSAASFNFRMRPVSGLSHASPAAASAAALSKQAGYSGTAGPSMSPPAGGGGWAPTQARVEEGDEGSEDWLVAAGLSAAPHGAHPESAVQVLQPGQAPRAGAPISSHAASVERGKALAGARTAPNAMVLLQPKAAAMAQRQEQQWTAETEDRFEEEEVEEEASSASVGRAAGQPVAAGIAQVAEQPGSASESEADDDDGGAPGMGMGAIAASPAALAALGLGPAAPPATVSIVQAHQDPMPAYGMVLQPQHQLAMHGMAPASVSTAAMPVSLPAPQAPVAAAVSGAPVALVSASPVAGATPQEPDIDDLMREIQQLSALRRALKSEFESLGHGDAVAGLQTLSGNFSVADASGASAGAGPPTASQPEPIGSALAPIAEASQPDTPAGPAHAPPAPPAAAAAASAGAASGLGAGWAPRQSDDQDSVPRAPLLQWNFPGDGAAAAPGVALAHQQALQNPMMPYQQPMAWAMPVQPESQHHSSQQASFLQQQVVLQQQPLSLPQAQQHAAYGAPAASAGTDGAPMQGSFAFAGRAGQLQPMPATAAAAPPGPAVPVMQWTIPAEAAGSPPAAAAAAGNARSTTPQRTRQQQPSSPGYSAGLAAKAQQQQDRKGATSTGRGATGPRDGTGQVAVERPLINDGSYMQAALQARERAEREHAEREAIQAQQAAAKAAALMRSKSERTVGANGGLTPHAAGPHGPKAPSHIGSYSQPPQPPAAPQPQRPGMSRSNSTGRGAGVPASAPVSAAATPAANTGRGAALSAPNTPDALPKLGSNQQQQQHAWGTPTGRSRIPVPPPSGRPAGGATPGGPLDAQASLDDSFGSEDYAFLERALESSRDDDTPPTRGRQAFAEAPSVPGYQHPASRPQPLRIPASGASTPAARGGPLSTASTVASHAVPTGAGARGAMPGRSGASGSKPATPFTQAIRELMGLPGSAPLEQSKLATRNTDGRGHATRLSAEEEKLLQSLQRLDAQILTKGLRAAGLINDGDGSHPHHGTPAASRPAAGRGAGASPASGGKGKGTTPSSRAAAGGAGAGVGGRAGGAGKSDPLNNSMQLRDSLERLDLRLGQLRRKMEDRACMVGVPAMMAGIAATPTAASTPMSNGPQRTPGAQRDGGRGGAFTPQGPVKAKTPTPNKAKAIRDQRQAQLSAGQGPTPPPARPAPSGYGPGKPASAPAAAMDGGGFGGGYGAAGPVPGSAAAAGGYDGRQGLPMPPGMAHAMLPPKAPTAGGTPTKAPASAPSSGVQVRWPGAPMQHLSSPGGGGGGPSSAQMQGNGMHMMQGAPMPQQQQQAEPPQQQQQQQVAYMPVMLPNGQLAYVPQYVNSQPGPAPAMLQQQPQQALQGGAGLMGSPMPGMMASPGQMLQQPMQFNGMMMPQQQQQQASGAFGMPMMPGNGFVQQQQLQQPMQAGTPHGAPIAMAWGDQQMVMQQQQMQMQQRQQQLQQLQQQHDMLLGHGLAGIPSPNLYSFSFSERQQSHAQAQSGQPVSPPPTGPIPHYHSTVMRQRSIGSRDGEAAAMAAAALQGAGLLQGGGGLQQQQSGVFPGRSAGSASGAGAASPAAADGVIKAVNLGLLLS